jgi:hypothetical protein
MMIVSRTDGSRAFERILFSSIAIKSTNVYRIRPETRAYVHRCFRVAIRGANGLVCACTSSDRCCFVAVACTLPHVSQRFASRSDKRSACILAVFDVSYRYVRIANSMVEYSAFNRQVPGSSPGRFIHNRLARSLIASETHI